jgi:PAS domain S-box-containing protein
MDIKEAIKKIAVTAVFLVVIIGVFLLTRKNFATDSTESALISILAAVALKYIYDKYISGLLARSEDILNDQHQIKTLKAQHKRLDEKVQKLTAELETANSKLKAVISGQPLDQRELQMRLKHLACMYSLSKIVNKQEISLEQIFQETVRFIRQAHRYPDNIRVRLTLYGVRFKTDDFEKSELSRQVQINAHEENVGSIEAYYIGKDLQNGQSDKIPSGQEPFLREEEDLLCAVAQWLGSIAERKKAEDKMVLFRNLVERSNDCIFVIEPKWGRILDANSRACDSLGYSPKEIVGAITIRNLDDSITDDNVWSNLVTQLREKGDFVKEARYQRKDGVKFFVETSLKLVLQEKQEYIIAIARDITERKRAESKLKTAQEKLLETARMVGMAEVATGVLHNVGNVLNSVSVTAESVQKRIRGSKISYLSDVINLLTAHSGDMGAFMSSDQRGTKIPAFLANLYAELIDEQKKGLESLEALTRHVQHVADIIQLQQSYSKTKGLTEPASIAELVEDALKINAESLSRNNVQVKREFANMPVALLDRHKVLQMLTNLISNAVYAMSQSESPDRVLTIRVTEPQDGFMSIAVQDNGIGIPQENINRIFEHGFTTKKKGHGFGLHSTALSVNELGGSIKVHSDGPGHGALFTIRLPFKPQEATA